MYVDKDELELLKEVIKIGLDAEIEAYKEIIEVDNFSSDLQSFSFELGFLCCHGMLGIFDDDERRVHLKKQLQHFNEIIEKEKK